MRKRPSAEAGEVRAVHRLVRRADHKLLAGVAGGLADYTGIDPVIFRIGFIVLTLAGGTGILLYLLAWLMIPKATASSSPAERAFRRISGIPTWLGLVLLVAAVALLGGQFEVPSSSAVWAVLLMAVGVLLLREDSIEDVLAPATTVEAGEGEPEATGSGADAPAARRRWRLRRRKERSALGWFSVAGLLLIIGAVAALHNLGTLELQLGDYTALGLLIVGAGLIIGAWWGRARLLILLGTALLPVVLAASLIRLPLEGRVGDHSIRPTSVAGVDRDYRLLFGRMTLDLSKVAFGSRSVEVDIGVVAGGLDVFVPRGITVNVTGTAEAGQLVVLGRGDSGFDLAVRRSMGGPRAEGELTLNIEAGIADVSVYRLEADGANR